MFVGTSLLTSLACEVKTIAVPMYEYPITRFVSVAV